MADKRPLVSVIMPTYNTKKEYLREAVQSILNQTYKNIEFIIANDGSDEEIMPQIADICDERVQILECKENRKLAICSNEALKLSKGKYIARMDSDDIAYPERIAKQVDFFEKNKGTEVLGSSIEYFGDREGIRKLNLSKTREEQQVDLLFGNPMIPHPTSMFRKSFIEEYQLKYSEEFGEGSEDYELWTQVTRVSKIDCLLEPLLKYRSHATQITQAKKESLYGQSEKVRWKQLLQIKIIPTAKQKEIHRKLCLRETFKSEDLKTADRWIELIIKKNNENLYFDRSVLKKKLYQRMAALYKKYLVETKDLKAVFYIAKYFTVDNLKNWFQRKWNWRKEKHT